MNEWLKQLAKERKWGNQLGKTSPQKGRFLIASKLLEMAFEADGVLRAIQPDHPSNRQACIGGIKK